MGYKQKSGPLQRAGYDKNATTPFLLEETEAGTNLAAGQRDEFGTLIPEGDFSEGVTVTAKMPERTKKAVQTLAQNLRVRQGNIVGDPSASRLKVGKATPEKVAGVTEFTISQFGGGSDKGLLSKISKAQQAAKEHRKAQKGTKL